MLLTLRSAALLLLPGRRLRLVLVAVGRRSFESSRGPVRDVNHSWTARPRFLGAVESSIHVHRR